MKILQFYKISILAVSLVLLGGLSTVKAENVSPASEIMLNSDRKILSELIQTNIIYLGETHDNPEDHQKQLQILQALHQHQSKIAIALEMFQRPFQTAIDRYLAGEITEAELRQQTEYDDRWGYDWEFYAPILRYAKTHKLPVLALNVPSEIARKVAAGGLESLSPEESQQIPPASEIRTDNAAYRQRLEVEFNRHLEAGHGNSKGFERFFLVQVLWDETMAETIAQFWQDRPDYQIVVLAGKGHIEYGDGIPSRVERRLQGSYFVQRSVWLGEFPEGETEPADFAWP
ncbi:ChaN family lipoprotein [Oscillatoria sp. FACHB-1406]|uniref:ChaN family lipoprotein n=1 Tax=Oscillatoria sp. FACHB-1406 TaxID=2692846 RepID=UPI00168850D3|nr:ChaN family lipoprotein [Oscillatoria sp. FACHB-1406]MBD2580630.1 ChaN family lipoprotein [Oscillatoria sp. FACHB-1406]